MAVRFDLATAAEIRFGAGRVSELPEILAGLGVHRVLVVTGAGPVRAEPVRADLAEAGVVSDVFAVVGEPTVDLVRAGIAVAVEHGSAAVLGIGGGSALDAAKAIAVLAGGGTDPLDHLEVVGAGRPLTRPGLPCVAVPTTAGTGSEVTRNSVLSLGPVKASLRSPLLLPRVALVDPDLLVGQPPATIAASGSDALSQLVEPFLSSRANPVTDALARDGIRRSARSLARAVASGLDAAPDLREDLALASLFGGLCLANSGLGAVHGFAAVLGARYAAPHGALCAALLAPVVAANLAALRERDPQNPVVARVGEVAALVTGRRGATAADASPWLAELCQTLQVPGLSSYGFVEADVPEVLAQARAASSMKANPIELTDAELSAILRAAA
ncbi:MAG: iron-containing alcohol dehydrogenase [Dermatophilaceae bacterium]